MDEEILDLRGLKCPLPALYALKALRRAVPGAVLEVLVDDPMAPVDIPYMCHREGFEVVAMAKDARATRLRLRRPA